jgi:hypothetical protein
MVNDSDMSLRPQWRRRRYQGKWDVTFPAWGHKTVLVAWNADRERYHLSVLGLNFVPDHMTACEMGRWLAIHSAVRLHR